MPAVTSDHRAESGKSFFWVRVKPRSSRDAIVGQASDGAWEIRVQAPPVKGAANESCRRLLARALEVAPSRIWIERGEGARKKKISVVGVDSEEICRRLLKAVAEASKEKG